MKISGNFLLSHWLPCGKNLSLLCRVTTIKDIIMFLFLSPDKTLNEIQQSFTSKYPFLKLEFYKLQNNDPGLTVKKHLSHSLTLKAAGLKGNGLIDISNDMTVADLEKIFLHQFGLNAQVSRKSGILWLETTMTDKWTLQKQNEHGREITASTLQSRMDDRNREMLQ